MKIIQFGILIFLLLSSNLIFGQNFGLRQPQENSTLPKSLASCSKPERKPKKHTDGLLKPIYNLEYEITGGWELTEANKVYAAHQNLFDPSLNTSGWYDAIVPGTVLTTLVKQGIYPDPYWGLNNLAIPDSLCRMDWWYRTTFGKSVENAGYKAWLILNGINYKAEVWLNGVLLGKIEGAFQRGMFEVTRLLQGQNILAIHIYPPSNPGIPHEESPAAGTGPNGGQLCMDGPTFISSEGWDWIPGIRDRNIGIWQDVRLKYTGNVKIAETQIITDIPLPDTTQADINIKTWLLNTSFRKQSVTLSGKIENISFQQLVELEPGEEKLIELNPMVFPQLRLKAPRLWWPNGYGKPSLYDLELSLMYENSSLSDFQTIRFGIREFSYEITADSRSRQNIRLLYDPLKSIRDGRPIFDNTKRREIIPGVSIPAIRDEVSQGQLNEISGDGTSPYLVIRVNGQRVYCKGGNWGMDDGMKNCSREYLEPYIRLHRDAHLNMVRNWTGESTEENFYDLCDEYGMLVWNDFWLSTQGYNLEVNDNLLFLNNAREVIHRFRNHPSIVLWCPRNEGYAPPDLEDKLSQLVAAEDGTRYYQGNSRNLNLKPSGPWHYFKDPALYFTTLAQGFNTEQGTPSIPTAASMRKMMAEEDVWPIGDVWYYHDLHEGQKDYINDINRLYGKSDHLEDFCKKAQMVNYESHRAMFEAWNSKLWNNTTGLLLWMTHPAWPSTVWQIYSWDYETHGSYFASRKACEPIHVQFNLNDQKIVIVNTTLKTMNEMKVKLEVLNLQGKSLEQKEYTATVNANQLTEISNYSSSIILPDIYLIRLTLKDKNGNIQSINDYLKCKTDGNFNALNLLPDASLSIRSRNNLKATGTSYQIQVSNTGKTPALGIKLNLKKSTDHQIILPAYFSDGYFNLMPGESRMIEISPGNYSLNGLIICAEGYNLKSTELMKINLQP